MRIAIVCSAHGLGHLTRQLAVARALRLRGVEPVLFTEAPRSVVEAWLPQPSIVPWTADVGIVQSDSLTEDIPATRHALAQRCSDRAVDALASALAHADVGLVVADTPPAALEAARRADLSAVAVGNFTWPWTYAHYPALQGWGKRLAQWQASHPAAVLWPGPGMPGFASETQFGLVGRIARHVPAWPRGRVLVSFGGFGLDQLDARLPVIDGVQWVMAPPFQPLERPDCLYVDDLAYPQLVAASEVVLTKPGYGILAETALSGTKLVWIPRGAFPEARFITRELASRGDRSVHLRPEDPPPVWRSRLATTIRARLADPAPKVMTRDESQRLADWLISKTQT